MPNSYKYIIMHANLQIQKPTMHFSKSKMHAMHTLSLTHTHMHRDTPPLLYPSSFRQRATHTTPTPKPPSYCHTISLCLPLHLPLFSSIGGQKLGANSKGRVWRMHCLCLVCILLCRT